MTEITKQTTLEKMDEAIHALIVALSSNDGVLRESVRQSLIALGEPAVDALIVALKNGNKHLRWEAAKALGEIHSPKAIPSLVEALRDKEYNVRWLAAEGLVAMHDKCLKPLMHTLKEYTDSPWVREGVHHVLNSFASDNKVHDIIAPVLEALEGLVTNLDIVTLARTAIDDLDRKYIH